MDSFPELIEKLKGATEWPALLQTEAILLRAIIEHGEDEIGGSDLYAGVAEWVRLSAMYVAMRRMERKGFVLSRPAKASGRGRPGRLYKVTALGAELLRLTERLAAAQQEVLV